MSVLGLAMPSAMLGASANLLFTCGLGFGERTLLSITGGFYLDAMIVMVCIVLRERPNKPQYIRIVPVLTAFVDLKPT